MLHPDALSPQRLKIYQWVRDQAAGGWVTNRDIVAGTGLGRRTVSNATVALTELGVLDRFELSGGHRFRLAPEPKGAARTYLARLAEVERVLA